MVGRPASPAPGAAPAVPVRSRVGRRLLRALVAVPLPLALVALVALAGLSLGRIYRGPLLPGLVLGAAAGAVALSCALRRAPAWSVAPVSVLAMSGYVLWTARLTAERAEVPGALFELTSDALRNGIPRLLNAMIPVEPQPDTVLVPVVAAWLAALTSAEVSLRAGRMLLGCLPSALFYAGALYVVGPNAAPSVWPTLAYAVVVALSLTIAAQPSPTTTGAAGGGFLDGPAALAGSGLGPAGTPRRPGAHGPGEPGTSESGGAAGKPGSAGPGGTAGEPGASGPDGRPVLGAAARAALRLRLAAGTAAGLALVVGLAALLGPAVAAQVTAKPVDPRRYVPPPPQLDTLDENPLVRISGWALSPDQRLFDLRLSGVGDAGGTRGDTGDSLGANGGKSGTTDPHGNGNADDGGTTGGNGGTTDAGGAGPGADDGGHPPADLRIRLAVLSDYDGVTWRVGATYRSAGRALPPPQRPTGTRPRLLRQDITIADLAGRLLPAAATPQLVDGVRVAYDPATGTLIRPEGLLPGVRYAVESAVRPPEVNLLAGADVPSGPPVARLLALGDGVPEQMERLARQLGANSGAPYDRAVAIEQFLAEHYRLVTDAPSGHAYPNLSFFLFGPRNGGGQRGTSEQFAAAYAVLARLLGLPARVVVGFRAAPGGGPVRGADALAWPEVLFNEVGWVPFNPLPQADTRPRPVEEDFRPKPERSTPPPQDEPTPTAAPTRSVPPRAGTPDARAAGLSTGTVLALAAGALVLALTGYAGAVPLLVRSRRRRWLSDPDPARRVAGAWLEVVDALRLAGHPPSAHLSVTEVVAHARAALPPLHSQPAPHGQPALDDLAELVNTAAFGGTRPDPLRASAAGAEALAYARRLRSRQPWLRRMLWVLHPGPLHWHRR